MLLACLVSASMFVLFVEASKLLTSLDISGYKPAIGVGLLFISGIFLIAIFHYSSCFFDGLPTTMIIFIPFDYGVMSK